MYRISLTIAHTLQYYILLAGNWQNIAKSVGKDVADFSLLTYKWFVVLSPEICLLKEKWLHTQLLYTGFRILKLVICSHIIIIASWSQRLMFLTAVECWMKALKIPVIIDLLHVSCWSEPFSFLLISQLVINFTVNNC